MADKHTAGPWYVFRPYRGAGPTRDLWIEPRRGEHIASVGNGMFGAMPQVEREANAALLAAAPELLTAAQALTEWDKDPYYPDTGYPGEDVDWERLDNVIRLARAAIEKAVAEVPS